MYLNFVPSFLSKHTKTVLQLQLILLDFMRQKFVLKSFWKKRPKSAMSIVHIENIHPERKCSRKVALLNFLPYLFKYNLLRHSKIINYLF